MAKKVTVTNLKPVVVKLGRTAPAPKAAPPAAPRPATAVTPQAMRVFKLGKEQQKAQARVD